MYEFHLIIYLCLCIFGSYSSILSTATSASSFSVTPFDFQEQCIQGCPFQNHTDATAHFVGDVEQCTSGCKLWRSALDSSCKAVCNGTQDWLPPKQLYCVIGCNDAVSRYLNQLRSELGTLPAPALVADTLKATSLSLEWSWNRHPVTQQSHIKYLVQWRYEELAAAWQYCRNQTWSSKHDTVFVDNLQPYTKYRFRVAVLLWPNNADELVVSEPSVVISTLPLGVPSSAPIIVRAVAVDSSRISISWEPGPFPNGPILSYVLQIVSKDHHPVLKDIPAQNNTDFYMFKHLQSSRNYTVSVSMRNSFGEGPAASVTLATPSEYIVNQTVPVLILGADHTVIQQSADMLEEPIILYKSIKVIKGVAIHVNYKLLFISDSDGYVWRIPLPQNQHRTKSRKAILKPDTINFSLPLDLSVDWLNDQIYILEEVTHSRKSRMWQITRCSLDGSSSVVAMAGFVTKPHHIEVDPYNGYLFWVNNIGLWRLDLADSSNGIRREISPLQLLFEPNLGAFTVDHTNFRLLVPHQQKNTVLSVSLDGREIIDLRSNTQSPMFNNVTSIATANGLFYWTNGNEVIAEEYNKATDSYFHNTFPEFDLIDRLFISLCVNLPISQPIPVPINPTTSVQAILGSTKAKVSWQIPHLLGGQGKGAWQNWSYELQILDINNNKIHNQPNINATTFTINNLKENTEYIFKTAAYTRSGRGPWSSEFRGRTLNTSSNVKFVWSAKEGLLWSDVTGDSVHILLHKTNEYHVTDITWINNILYMATNTTRVYQYDLISEKLDQMNEIDSASSIAVDWIGKKLYWSNPKQQLITRGNLNGGQHEPLPIVTLARELNIDSINAYLYWSNGHSVECARLNGAERRPYYSGQLFSGKQVMGLTIDIDQHIVYWIVRSFEGSTLFHAPTAEQLTPTSEITMMYRQHHLQQNDIQGPLCFFSQRLLWLQDPNKTIIGDLNGQNTAILSGTRLNGLKMVTVKDDTLHVYPSNLNKYNINVIPASVDASLIKIEGPFNQFNITWNPVTNVNYGQVFYEIKAGNLYPDTSISTTENSILYWQELPPYSELKVTIRAFTYWGSATPSRANLRSPPSTPSKPENVRLFVEFENRPFYKKNKIAIFRWSEPIHTNGVIQGYFVDCWYEDINGEKIKVYENYQVPSVQYEFTTKLLLDNFTYFFQVVAYTEMGTGDPSDIISGDMNTEIYVPKLLVASEDTIFIKDFDSDSSMIVAKSNGKIIDIAYLYNERKVIWLNDLQEIFISNLDRTNRTKLVTLNNTGVSITVDWIQRCLYWVQFNQQTHESSIYSFDLNTINDDILTIQKLVTRPTKIHHIEASPLSSTLYWTESSYNDDHTNIIKTCNYNGDNIETFFSNEPGNLCNCTQFMQIDRSFTLTINEQNDVNLLFINKKRQLIIDADFLGCYCRIIQSNTINDYTKSLTATNDDNIYYVNSGKIYTNYNQLQTNYETNEIINTFGSYKQLFANEYCLIPYQSTSLEVTLYNRSAHSLILKMPKPEQNAMDALECSSTMPSIQYRILYRQYKENDALKCNKYSDIILTYDNYLKVHDLKPFTKYIFCLVVSNYYSVLADKTLVIGTGVVLQTAAGAPSKAENVTVSVLNPTAIKVNWDPPIEINDETVSYEVHWRTEEAIGNRQKGELETMNERQAVLQKLLQNHMYSIWIRTYSPNSETYTDSELIQIETYQEPNNIILRNITAYSISFIWEKSANITNHMIKYTKVGVNSWTILPLASIVNVSDNVYFYTVTKLQPKTLYEFQLLLSYINFNETYVWPTDGRFKFQTLGDKPSAPGVPIIEHVRGDVYRIVWEMSNDNGSPIREYRLEGHTDSSTQITFPEKLLNRKRRNSNLTLNFDDEFSNKLLNKDESPENYSTLESSEPYIDEDEIEINWEVYYNGTENYWLITDLVPHQKYWFRVCAYNEYGWGPYSGVSEEFEAGTEASGARLAHRSQQFTILLAIVVPILVAVCLLTVCSLFCICKRRKKDSKLPTAATPVTTLGPDVELAILRDMPRGRPGGTFVHSTNILYTSSDLPLGDSPDSLPHIKRDQITLTKFLGSGAFGEVFEGKAKCLDGIAGETRVAVKTLRKGASPQERSEFLREAQLMAHFKHKHILRLLGVCRDNDPHFIIMELMQAGDLLSYLRSSRPLLDTSQALTLRDLIEMCVDVSKGCCYLEEQHFVHRDLACRNCLVSSADPSTRVVKIGDFGLARDIYKNDYYRKEGEGLLPVRWMAPESLVDGVFTSQSDVWAFGVLMWEIMTLGQQPYPARTNLEVLHYVRNGGRLHRPNNCPEDLHQLMLKCWSYNQECRPTFKYCLEILEKLKQHIIINALQLNSVETMNGTLRRLDARNCLTNPSYMLDYNSNLSESSDPTSQVDETTISPSTESRNGDTIENNPSEIPKYLELVYVSEDEMEPITPTDGYEVPRSSLRSNKSNNNIPQIPPLNRKRPLSANSSLQRNNSAGRFQPPRVMRSNSTISNRSKSINMIRRGSFNSASITRSSSFIRPKSISPSTTSVSSSTNHSTNGGSCLSSNGIIINGNSLRNGNNDITSELLLPQKNMKFCTYSNIAQAQKPLLTEISNLTTNVSNDARHGNRGSLNTHSIC